MIYTVYYSFIGQFEESEWQHKTVHALNADDASYSVVGPFACRNWLVRKVVQHV